MVITRFPCFRYANLFEDGCDHSGSVVTVSYREKTEAASVEATWMGEFKKNAKHRREFQIKNLNPCQKYEVKVSVGNRDLLFEVGPFYSEKQTLAYLENEENEAFKTENEEAAKSISNANISITDTSASLKIPANQFCAQSIGISLHQGAGGTERCEEMKITHREAESSAAAANSDVVAFDNLLPCTNYNVMLDVFLNRRDPLPTIAGDFQKPSVTSFFTLPTTDDLKKDEFVQYNATTKNFSWDFTEFFERPCAGFDFSY